MEVPLIIAVVAGLALLSIWWTISRSRSILENWAARNGFQIEDAHLCWLWRGPFFWTSSKGQAVYRVIIYDAEGRMRQGWVRCGNFWWGIFVDEADVRWDD
jgi:hypothetical protein